MTKSVVFLGNEHLSSAADYKQTPILEALLKNGQNVEALIIKRKPAISRQKQHSASLDLAQRYNLTTIIVTDLIELKQALKGFSSDLAVLASFGLLLSQDVLDHFRLGIINVHPSLLPHGRGPTPIESSLLHGETKTGISLIKLNQHLDAGDIYTQTETAILSGETKLSLTKRLGQLAAETLIANLDSIRGGQLKPVAQNEAGASYTKHIKAGEVLNFQEHEAIYLERYIRAFDNCPNNKFLLANEIVEIKSAHLAQPEKPPGDIFYIKESKLLYVRCEQGFLAIAELQPNNRNPMSAADFANGFLN